MKKAISIGLIGLLVAAAAGFLVAGGVVAYHLIHTSTDTAELLSTRLMLDQGSVSGETLPDAVDPLPGGEAPRASFGASDTSCPLDLPSMHGPISYQREAYVETWKAQAEASLPDYVTKLLYYLRDSGIEVVSGGYLDLFGNTWGCVVRLADTKVVTVTIKTSKSLLASSSTVLTEGWVEVAIVSILPPDIEP